MRKATILLALACSGCAASPATTYIHACPPLKSYTPAFERQVGAWLGRQPSDSPQAIWAEDYIALRKAVEDCKQ